MKKLTKADLFNQLKANYDLTNELVAFIDHELELLAKKNSSRSDKPTATQKENLALANDIYEFIKANPNATIKAISKHFDLSSQKVTPIVTKLVDNEKVSKVVEKRIAYFTVN